MDDLIEALTILKKYHDGGSGVTHCGHDELTVLGIECQRVSLNDRMRLDELGFYQSDGEDPHFYSFRFGSC